MPERRNMSPADEMGLIRLQLKDLKAREQKLRRDFLKLRSAQYGDEWKVEVVPQRRRTFVRDALPDDIVNDPRYWRETISYIVKTYRVAKPNVDIRTRQHTDQPSQPDLFRTTSIAEPEISLIDDGDI